MSESTRNAPQKRGTAAQAPKPSGRQIYRIAYSLLEIAGIPAPETTRDASELIDRLTAQRAAALNVGADNAPF